MPALQFTVPVERLERSRKGFRSMEFNGLSVEGGQLVDRLIFPKGKTFALKDGLLFLDSLVRREAWLQPSKGIGPCEK